MSLYFKGIDMRYSILITTLISICCAVGVSLHGKAPAKQHTVLVVVEAKPGMEQVLEATLAAVVEPSRSESTNIEYRLHRDINNPAQFFLYENWTSAADHQLQFQKPYIVELVGKLGDLLAKPYICILGQELYAQK